MTDHGDTYCSSLASQLAELTGKNITVYIDSGSYSGSGFSGVLIAVNNDYIKILTEKTCRRMIKRWPRNPLRRLLYRRSFRNSYDIYKDELVRSIVVIKIDKIVSYTFNNNTLAMAPQVFYNIKSPNRFRKRLGKICALTACFIKRLRSI